MHKLSPEMKRKFEGLHCGRIVDNLNGGKKIVVISDGGILYIWLNHQQKWGRYKNPVVFMPKIANRVNKESASPKDIDNGNVQTLKSSN